MTIKLQRVPKTLLFIWVCLVWLPLPVSSQTGNAAGKAGHIVMGSGRLTALATDGIERRLRRKAAIYAGDTIIVGNNAFAQVRFTDGGLFSLRPGTQFRVNEYHHNPTESENGKVVFELLKGGLRTISGTIGKKQQENYRLKTPISTIGIRGTHYGVRLCEGDCLSSKGEAAPKGLYGGVVQGEIRVKNAAGEEIFGSENYFHVAANDAPINSLLGPPGFLFDPAMNGPLPTGGKAAPKSTGKPLSGFSSKKGSMLSVFGNRPLGPSILDPRTINDEPPENKFALKLAPMWSGAAIAGIFNDHTAEAKPGIQNGVDTKLFIDDQNNIIRLEHFDAVDCSPCAVGRGIATLTHDAMPTGGFDLPAGSKVYWGRWQDGWISQDGRNIGPGHGSWHFMYSPDVTNKDELMALTNSTATFNVIHWTTPTDEAGFEGTLNSATMGVDFLNNKISSFDVNVQFAARPGPVPSRNFNGTLLGGGVTFTGPRVELPLDVTCSGCNFSVTGGSGAAGVVFVGAGASHAMTSFQMSSDNGVDQAVGTALLAQ